MMTSLCGHQQLNLKGQHDMMTSQTKRHDDVTLLTPAAEPAQTARHDELTMAAMTAVVTHLLEG